MQKISHLAAKVTRSLFELRVLRRVTHVAFWSPRPVHITASMRRSKTHQFRRLVSLHPSVCQLLKQTHHIWVTKCSTIKGRMHNQHVRFALPVICTEEASAFFSQGFANFCSTCFHHLCICGFVCGTQGRYLKKNTIFIKPFKKGTRFLNKDTRPTSATSVTTSSSGKIHVSTPIKEQLHLLLTAVAWQPVANVLLSKYLSHAAAALAVI